MRRRAATQTEQPLHHPVPLQKPPSASPAPRTAPGQRPHRHPAARLARAQRVERGKALGLAALHAGARVLLLAELALQGESHGPDLRRQEGEGAAATSVGIPHSTALSDGGTLPTRGTPACQTAVHRPAGRGSVAESPNAQARQATALPPATPGPSAACAPTWQGLPHQDMALGPPCAGPARRPACAAHAPPHPHASPAATGRRWGAPSGRRRCASARRPALRG